MTIEHHPDIATLLAFSAGTLDGPYATVIATHLVACVAVSVMGSLGLRPYSPLWDMATRLPWRSVCTRLSRSSVLPASTAPSPPG